MAMSITQTCNTTPWGCAPAAKVVYRHALFAPETFAPAACSPRRTGSSRAALTLSFLAFLSSLNCHTLHRSEMWAQISTPCRQQPSVWKCRSHGSACSTPAGIGFTGQNLRHLWSCSFRVTVTFHFWNQWDPKPLQQTLLSTTNFMNHFQACQMSAVWMGIITLAAALAEELSHTQTLASIQDYGWFLGGCDIQDVRINAVMVCCGLEVHKLHREGVQMLIL